MKKWLVAYVRLHHEKKTAERLTAMNIENFLPVQEEIRQWTYRKKKIKRVVIPMMIFVHVDAAERSQVLTLSAISRYMVLHGEHTPAVIPDEQMEQIKLKKEQLLSILEGKQKQDKHELVIQVEE